jgi:hypothetical protein
MLPLMGWQAFQGPLSPEMLDKMRSIRFCVIGIFVAAVGRFATGDPPITELLCGITGVFLLKDDVNLAACYNCLMSTPLENCAGPPGGGFGCLQSFLFISGFNSILMLLNLSSRWQQGMSHGGPFSLLSLIFQGFGAVYAWRLSNLVSAAQQEQGGNQELLSDAERRFLRDYWHNKKQFLDNRFLSVLPPVKAKLEDHMLRRPNLDGAVMLQVNDEIPAIMMPARSQSQGESPGSQEPLNLKPGGTYLLKYNLVRSYFMDEALQGRVQLV